MISQAIKKANDFNEGQDWDKNKADYLRIDKGRRGAFKETLGFDATNYMTAIDNQITNSTKLSQEFVA